MVRLAVAAMALLLGASQATAAFDSSSQSRAVSAESHLHGTQPACPAAGCACVPVDLTDDDSDSTLSAGVVDLEAEVDHALPLAADPAGRANQHSDVAAGLASGWGSAEAGGAHDQGFDPCLYWVNEDSLAQSDFSLAFSLAEPRSFTFSASAFQAAFPYGSLSECVVVLTGEQGVVAEVDAIRAPYCPEPPCEPASGEWSGTLEPGAYTLEAHARAEADFVDAELSAGFAAAGWSFTLEVEDAALPVPALGPTAVFGLALGLGCAGAWALRLRPGARGGAQG